MKVYIDDLIGADGEVKGKIYIESSSKEVTIAVYNGKKDGKGNELYKNVGYYVTLTGAIRAVIRMKISESTAKELNELVIELKRIEESIQSKLEVVHG